MKLRGVEVSETVCRLLDRTKLAEITWEALSIVSLVLSSVWHMRRDVHQTGNDGSVPASVITDYSSPITVSDKNRRSILYC